jgi:hypothetical protein
MNVHLSSFATASAILGLVAVAVFNLWTSRFNIFFFFGCTATTDFAQSAAGLQITRTYTRRVIVGTLVSLAVFPLLRADTRLSVYTAFLLALVLQVIGHNLSFALAHQAAGKALRQAFDEPGSALDAPAEVAISLAPTQPPLSLVAMLAPAATAACLWLVAWLWSREGLSAFVDRAGPHYGATLLGMATGMLFSGTGMLLLIRYSARHRTRMAHYMARILLTLAWCATLIAAAVACAALLHHSITKAQHHFVLGAVLGFLALHFLYGWSRQRQFTPAPIERNGDEKWLWGMYYCNRQDPALFIQNRCGMGYTLNFGNIFSWPIALFVVADFVFLAVHHARV